MRLAQDIGSPAGQINEALISADISNESISSLAQNGDGSDEQLEKKDEDNFQILFNVVLFTSSQHTQVITSSMDENGVGHSSAHGSRP